MPSCAGLITVHYKIAVAKALSDELLPRVGDDVDSARHHMQRTLNALVAPGAHAATEHKRTADSAGYHEIVGVVGNPVHGMGDEEGMGILPHLRVLGQTHASANEAIRIIELAQEYAAACLETEDVSAIKRGGRVVASLLRAAQEALH